MIGTQLGPWRIVRELGTGGMGTVYLGEAGRRRAAIKVVHPHLLASPGYFKRFLREAQIGKTISHPNLVRIFDADAIQLPDRTVHYLVMEYVEGETLRELLRELGRLPEELCRHVAREMARGLAAVHAAGVIHRDLKPENVLITRDQQVKIMDLGVARVAHEAARLSQSGMFVGSIQYAAPEQFRSGDAEPDARADLFSLGVMLYEFASGARPHDAADLATAMRQVIEEEAPRISERNPQLSPFFDELVHKLLAKDPGERFASASELLEVLEQGEESEWWRTRERALRAESPRQLRRAWIPRETSLRGREAEIATLRQLYGHVAQGAGQVVLVEGEAGIGKSRLVDEFVRELDKTNARLHVLTGGYPPGGAATAAGAWSAAYRNHFGGDDLADALARHLPTTPLLVPAFAAMLRGDATPSGCEPLSREALQTCFSGVTRALADERPTIVVIEDLHYAPAEGRALFAALAHAVPGIRVLLIGTTRPVLPPEWVSGLERLEHVRRLELDRLAPEEIALVLEEALRSRTLAEALAASVGRRSDGNPFILFEILRSLRETGALTQDEHGIWSARVQLDEVTVPTSVRELIRARMSEIAEDERELLELAACAGFEFDGVLVGEVAALDPIVALRRLARLERRHRIVRAAGARFVFDHHLLHEELYRGLPAALRTRFHAAIAEALERRAGARQQGGVSGAAAVELCEHLLKGGRPDHALRYLDRALDHLQSSYHHGHALELLRPALAQSTELPGDRRVALLLREADLEEIGGRHAEMRAALTEALRIAERMADPGRCAAARQRLGRLLAALGEPDAAHRELERAVEEAGRAGDREAEAAARVRLGDCLHGLGRPADARRCYEQALASAEAVGSRQWVANANGNLGLLAWQEGRFDEAKERYERCLEEYRQLGDRRGEANAIGALGLLRDELGQFEEAAECHRRHLRAAREIGYRRGVSIALANLGDSLRMLGRLDDAVPCLEESQRLSEELGDRSGVIATLINLGSVVRHLGRAPDAVGGLERALRESRETGERRQEAEALFQLAAADMELGNLDRARESATAARDIFRDVRIRPGEGWASHLLGEILLRQGRAADASEPLADAVAIGHETGVSQLVALATCQLARAGRVGAEEAESVLRPRVDRLAPHERVEAFHSLWQAFARPEFLEEAGRRLDALLESVPEGRRETMVRGVTVFRQVRDAATGPATSPSATRGRKGD